MTDPLEDLDLSESTREALQAVKRTVEEAYLDELNFWKSCVKEIDKICDAQGVPTHDADGALLPTEDRVRMLVNENTLED